MAKKVPPRVEKAIEQEVKRTQENTIQAASNEIAEVLNKYGLGMMATIQIFKAPQGQSVNPDAPILTQDSSTGPLIIPGSENDPYKDVPPGIKDALMKPIGDGFGK